MTIVPSEATAVTMDFATLTLNNKNYKRAGVARIDPRDAYNRKQGSNAKRVYNHNNVGTGNTINSSTEKTVFKIDEDGVSFVSTENGQHTIRDFDEGYDANIIDSSTDSEFVFLGGEDSDRPVGFTENEYLIEKGLAKSTIDSYRNHIQNLAWRQDNNNLNIDNHDQKVKTDDIYLSKPTLLLQDQIDIEASTQDAIETQEASKLAYQLSLRTKACANNKDAEQSSRLEFIGSRIVVGTLSLDERIRLEDRRKQEESNLPYHLHGIELTGWESKINWEGISSMEDNTQEEKKGTEEVSSYPDSKKILSQPFNTAFEGINLSNLISWDGADAKPGFNEKLGKYLGQLTLQDKVAGTSVAQTSGALPMLNPRPFNQSEEYKSRMERKAAGITSGPVSRIQSDMAKRNEEIEERQKKRAQREIDKTKRIKDVLGSIGALDGGTGRAITSSLMGPGGTERTGRPTRHHGSSLAHDSEYIEQLDMINNHSLVKADLSPIELRHYGRPLLPKNIFTADVILPWQLQIIVSPQNKVLNGKTGGSYQNSIMPGSISQSKIRNLSDLCPSEGKLVLIEYSEEKLPLKLMKGMASKIVNYYKGEKSKCPISAGGGDRPTRKKKHGLKNQDSDIKGSSGKIEKPPRLEVPISTSLNIRELIGKIGHKKHGENTYNANSSVTILPEGATEILKDDGPFLGKVTEGTTQTGIVNNLFVAPMHRHVPKSTDFLMILGRSKHETDDSKLGVVLRNMPENIFTAGQTEPKRKVYAPDSKGDKDFVGSFTTYQIAKALQSKKAKERCGLRFEEIKDGLFPFSDVLASPLRQRIKKVALYDKNTQIWTLKPIGMDDFEGIESLSRGFSPEGVAAHWSARCAEQYLRELGLQEISSMSTSVANITIVMSYLNGILEAAKKRKKTMTSYAKDMRRSKEYGLFAKAKEKLINSFKEIEYKTKIANFIYEEIQLTPWNLTTDFMDVHRNPQGTGQMKLTGFGDPSGQAAGFDFRRETDKPNKTALIKKGNKVEITGTDKDLRKLSMKEMARILLEEYNVKQSDIKNLKRWDRVHMIRELSSKAASDNAGDGMERYARGEKIKLRDKIEAYKKRIQAIWSRQLLFLQETEDQAFVEKSEGLQKDGNDGRDDEDEDDSEGDDDDEEDDLLTLVRNKMQDTQKKNELVRIGMNNGHLESSSKGRPSQDTADDAGDLAAFLREKEENLALTQNNDTKDSRVDEIASGKQYRHLYKDKQVIRRKITKTHADGSVSVTFKFIINDEEAIAQVSKKDPTKKSDIFDLKKKAYNVNNILSHSMFEDDESSIRMIHKRRTTRGRAGRRGDGDYVPPRGRGTGFQSKVKGKQERKKQKRKRDEDEDDIYLRPTIRRGTSNRKGRGSARELKPHAKLAELLEDIRSTVEKRPNSGPFHRPVDRIAFPTYYEIISNPIDLQTIRDKIKRYEYRAADSFIKDVEVMKNNAVKFNGFGSRIGTEATKIYEFVKSTIDANRDELTSIELAVEDQFNSGSKKRARSTTPRSVEASGNPASVTVDGIEQKVYLGNLQGPFGDQL